MAFRKYLPPVVYTALVCASIALEPILVIAQTSDSQQVNLSGRWELNRELSENAEAKLEAMHASGGGGHRPPPGMHGLGSLFGGGRNEVEQARDSFLRRPTGFVVKQDAERIEFADSDGRVRVLTANGKTQKVDGRDVRTRWEGRRLVSDTSFGGAKITETYDRVTSASQLIVTTKMEMGGREVSVRRVYELESPR